MGTYEQTVSFINCLLLLKLRYSGFGDKVKMDNHSMGIHTWLGYVINFVLFLIPRNKINDYI